MAHAYTPGLKVTRKTILRKERRLPLPGEVVVKVGDKVSAETVVARTELPGNVQPINVAGLLSIPPQEINSVMIKKVNDPVKKGEPIAESKSFFGLFRNTVTSPVDGYIESISNITGQVILREPPIPITVNAYVDGTVVEVIPNEGVVVETTASFIQGIFGIGGETIGEIMVVVNSPEEELTKDKITPEMKGKILIGGSYVTSEALKEAVKCGVKGVVVGAIDDKNLKDFLGYDIGVAITGNEQKGITLMITEGFGKLPMAKRTFELFLELNGKKASMNGATQIRAGVIRPEVIVAIPDGQPVSEESKEELSQGLAIGTMVRVIREPYFGKIGKVTALPPELQVIETEAKVRVLELEFENGERVIVPRANVEIIEE
uniref:KOW domain-containing protein n=1 Tax=candidate division WOR-3 bacterium TaxID=2052148 RepID=A0A7V3ZX48_UNCW3